MTTTMTTTLDHRPALRLTQLRPSEVRPARALAPAPAGRAAASSQRSGDRRDRHGLALSELFDARDDLGGVSLVADVLAEDLLWSV
jgi:hypothetical protein